MKTDDLPDLKYLHDSCKLGTSKDDKSVHNMSLDKLRSATNSTQIESTISSVPQRSKKTVHFDPSCESSRFKKKKINVTHSNVSMKHKIATTAENL